MKHKNRTIKKSGNTDVSEFPRPLKLENEVLRFISSSEDFKKYGMFDIVLISGSLQYINPYEEIISKVREVNPQYIIIDRIMIGNRKRICKQTVTKSMYEASYPVRIFVEEEIEKFWENDYKIIEKDVSSVPEVTYFPEGQANSQYFVFERCSVD